MKVEFVHSARSTGHLVVVAEGSGDEVALFIDWLDMVEIDTMTYAEYFTGIPFRERTGMQTFWCHVDDPDHAKRVLIKLRWM